MDTRSNAPQSWDTTATNRTVSAWRRDREESLWLWTSFIFKDEGFASPQNFPRSTGWFDKPKANCHVDNSDSSFSISKGQRWGNPLIFPGEQALACSVGLKMTLRYSVHSGCCKKQTNKGNLLSWSPLGIRFASSSCLRPISGRDHKQSRDSNVYHPQRQASSPSDEKLFSKDTKTALWT